MLLYFKMKQWCSLVLCPCTCTQRAAVMLCEIGDHEGSGAVKLGGYIHIFRANVLPPTSPSHNPCLSETSVPVLMNDKRGYSETPVPISQRTGRHILEDKRGLFSGTVLNAVWNKVCGTLCFSKTASLCEAALSGKAQQKWECKCSCIGYISLLHILLFIYNFVIICTFTKLRPLRYRLLQEIPFVLLSRLNY
jgi:hypothetical protein